jgi:hypothetical protein
VADIVKVRAILTFYSVLPRRMQSQSKGDIQP